jgi:nucleoid-associated protein YgaU
LGSSYAGFSQHRVVDGDTLFGIAENSYSDGNLWPRLFTANRDRISDPDLIQVGQVLRIPFEGP